MRPEQALEDLRFGARILRHAPGLSCAAILLFGLTSVVASYLPVFGASRVNVVDALRQE